MPDGYDRHDPKAAEQRVALAVVLDGLDVVSVGYRGLVDGLLALGRTDIPLARLAEGHVDALRILAQAERQPVTDVWYGVWGIPNWQQTGLRAESGPDGLRIDGTLRFASGAGVLDRALIPVWLPDGSHLLLDLDVTALPVDPTVWRTAAMQASLVVASSPSPMSESGETLWWANRTSILGDPASSQAVSGSPHAGPGRRAGPPTCCAPGIRAQPMRSSCGSAGYVRSWSRPSWLCALRLMSRGPDLTTDLQQAATEARAVTAEAVRRRLAEARLVTGPAGLALDDGISHAVPDLELYVLQQNSDSDAALLGDPERQP